MEHPGNNASNNANENININNDNVRRVENIMNIIDNSLYYNNNDNNNHNNDNHEPMNNVEVLPVVMRSNMLRMLYELRLPIYALGALGGGAAGAHDDDMEQAAVAVLARSLYDAPPVKRVIDIADGETGEKHGIREMTYDPETAEELKINTACGIWQEEFEAGEAIKVLPCNHAFRAEAITKWLTTEKAECPICRFKLESKEVIVHPSSEGAQYHYHDDDSDTDNDTGNDDDEVHQPPVDEQRARENNIMYRQNNVIYNRAHGGGAVDMGRDVYRGMSMPMNRLLQMRAGLVHGARAGAGVAGAAAGPRLQPSQPSQHSQPSQPPNIITNINNYYINQYQISAEEQEEADVEEAIRRSLE
jgi:hypothetical protein